MTRFTKEGQRGTGAADAGRASSAESPAEAGSHPRAPGPAAPGEGSAVERLDRALLGIRRAVTLAEITSMPLPERPGGLDVAKAMACMAVADLTSERPGRTVSVKDVAQTLALEHSTASRLLADTEAEGLVARGTDPDDRRRTSVRLTEVGERAVIRIVAARTWALQTLLAEWSGEDIVRFAGYVERFTTTMHTRLDGAVGEAVTRFIESEDLTN